MVSASLALLFYHLVIGYYLAEFIATVVLLAVMLALWTIATVVTVRQLTLSPSLLQVESVLASAVAMAMIVVTTATAVWWAAMATTAPWFLNGGHIGSAGLPFDPRLIMTTALMFLAAVVALYGANRARSWRGYLPVRSLS